MTCRLAAPILVLVLALFACGSDDVTSTDSTTTTTAATTTAPTTTTSEPAATTTTDVATTTSTSEPATTTSTTDASTTTLAGEPFDLFIEPGDVLGVVGVQYDDVLNIRQGPGADQAIVATAAPLADDLVATGQERLLPASIWYEVTTGDGTTGWASAAFLAYLGDVDDATAEWQAENTMGEVETMAEMAETIAASFASEDPPSKIVRSDAGGAGDLGDTTYDVIGLADDSQLGWRLHVFGTPSEDSDGYFLKSIERTLLCTRGLSDGICV